MFERRTHIRIPVGLQGRYHLAQKMASLRLGLTQDISLGGMRMACTERIDPGERIAVDLPLPREGEVGLTGVVLWSRKSEAVPGGYEVGLRWAGADPAAQARLSSYISQYTRAQSSQVTIGLAQPEPFVSWPRTIAAALFLSALLLVGAQIWLSWYEMSLESRSLQYALTSQQLLQSRLSGR